jgi:hypothetical protein
LIGLIDLSFKGTKLAPLMLITGFFKETFLFGEVNSFLKDFGITLAGIYVILPTLIVLIFPDFVGVIDFN